MKTIPIYDATAPIVCTATGGALAKRIQEIERLRTNLSSIERSEHGMTLRFPNRADVADDLRRFAVEEKRCCQFWGFDIARMHGELILRWDAPPNADDLVARLLAYFEGDEPLSAISGLL